MKNDMLYQMSTDDDKAAYNNLHITFTSRAHRRQIRTKGRNIIYRRRGKFNEAGVGVMEGFSHQHNGHYEHLNLHM